MVKVVLLTNSLHTVQLFQISMNFQWKVPAGMRSIDRPSHAGHCSDIIYLWTSTKPHYTCQVRPSTYTCAIAA